MWHRRMAWIDPVDAAARLTDLPQLAFLDSAMTHQDLGRFSYVAADPFGRFESLGARASWNKRALADAPLEALRRKLAAFHGPRIAGLPPFQGGAIGIVGYEFGWTLEGRAPPTPSPCNDIDLAFYDAVLAFDHAERACWIIASGWPETEPERRRARATARLAAFEERLSRPLREADPPIDISWRATATPAAFKAGVERIKAYIRAGDIYQANLAQRFTAAMPEGLDTWSPYRRLRAANPAPFGAYLAQESRAVLSTSPELFLRSDGRRVETRPIKGTIRRSETDDASAQRRLATSRKDRAENTMIVDLLRNDLSKVCAPTSIEVPALCHVESYAGLHHLVSAVTGRLEGADAVDLLAATFPGGSITGAPKLRAMEIIAEIEGRPRGVYCGAIGAFGFDGSLALNIAIRTLVVESGALELATGGGITLLSEADAEYEETLTKAHRIFAGLSAARATADA